MQDRRRNKPGYLTSEFWLTLLSLALIVLNEKLDLNLTCNDLILLATAAIGTYNVSRGISKRKDIPPSTPQ